jgi:hypothetical protein
VAPDKQTTTIITLEASTTDPWMLFLYALKAPATRDKCIQRLMKFLDFLGYTGIRKKKPVLAVVAIVLCLTTRPSHNRERFFHRNPLGLLKNRLKTLFRTSYTPLNRCSDVTLLLSYSTPEANRLFNLQYFHQSIYAYQ